MSAGSVTLFTAYWIFTGMLFLFPSWLQDVQHESIVAVGMLLVPFRGGVRRTVDAFERRSSPASASGP